MLPPMPPENSRRRDIKVKERATLFWYSSPAAADHMAEFEPAGVYRPPCQKDRTKEFILNPMGEFITSRDEGGRSSSL